MNPAPPPVELVCLAAAALGDLCDRVTFLGGAVVGLLVTDPAAERPRPTEDVDVAIEVATKAGYDEFEELLRKRGFSNVAAGPICRYSRPPVMLDVMPTHSGVLGFANRWYADAVATAERMLLPNGITINLTSPACFLAAKLEAFDSDDREGHGDMRASKDFEDIVAVIDGRPTIVDDVLAAKQAVRDYLCRRFCAFLEDPTFEEGVAANLGPDEASQARARVVIERIRAFVAP